jgi:type IV pilus assembly protein PilN
MQIAERMIRINLLPMTEHAARPRVALPSMSAAAPFIILVALVAGLGAVFALQTMRVRHLRGEIATLKAEAIELGPLIQRIDQLTRERELTLKRLAVIENLDQDRLARVRLTDELAKRLPDYMWLTGFSEQSGSIVLNGVTFSNLLVAELIRTLERSVYYDQVDLVVAQRGTIDDRSVVNFTISARRQTTPDPAPVEAVAAPFGAAPVAVPEPALKSGT